MEIGSEKNKRRIPIGDSGPVGKSTSQSVNRILSISKAGRKREYHGWRKRTKQDWHMRSRAPVVRQSDTR
jgi:hypothetical protein